MSSPLSATNSLARRLLVLCCLTFGVSSLSAEQAKNLKPQGYVSDFAGVLSAPVKDKLAALCAEVDQRANAQIAVVTVSSLEGQPIEQFSIDLATAWGIGPDKKDRGILILLATNDRRYRIEAGYGLEGILPDGKVGGFGREAVPLLRQNDYGGAVLLMTQRVAQVIADDAKVKLDSLSGAPPPAEEPDNPLFSMSSIVWLLIIFIFVVSPAAGFLFQLLLGGVFGSRRGRWGGGPPYGGGGWYGGGSWGGGGSSGGGGGFGGFGGGSFGGGGASGSW